MMMTMLIPISGYAANLFLDTPDDKPVSAKFSGTEWSDDIGQQGIPPHSQSSDNAYGKNAVGRNLESRIHGS
jgi:hypothetical protein